MVEVDDWVQKQIFPSGLSGVTYLTTITGFLWEFIHLSLKTCSLYHEKLFIQKFKDISSQVLNNFFWFIPQWQLCLPNGASISLLFYLTFRYSNLLGVGSMEE